jgi:hypothetical protein|tara:strand:+ start:8762 stop:9199 length:438 start_codon:yes stop_codon:yes gene_type:complete
MINILLSLVITSIISTFFGFGFSNIVGFWQAFAIAAGLQIIIALIYKSFQIEQRSSNSSDVEQQFNDLLSLSTINFICPCSKYTFTEEVFAATENVFKCPECNSNVKVHLNASTVLQTDVLNTDITNDVQSVLGSNVGGESEKEI